MTKPIEILVLSFDGYADVWQLFFDHFFEHWSDCPYPISLLTNHEIYADNRVRSLCVGADKDWSSSVQKALEKMESTYVLTIFDDLILQKKVETERVNGLFNWVLNEKADYLRLNPNPLPNSKINTDIGKVAKGALYRVSLCATIIRRETLLELLKTGESAWEFEFRGTERSDENDSFYATYHPTFHYLNAIEKGKWTQAVLPILKKYDPIDPQKRGVLPTNFYQKWLMQLKAIVLYRIIPPQYQRQILAWKQRWAARF